jgi:hypothetical protein
MPLSGKALGRCSMTRVFSVTTRVSTAEARNQHRDLLRRLGAAGGALWIAEFRDSLAERNRRARGGRRHQPGQPAVGVQRVQGGGEGTIRRPVLVAIKRLMSLSS